MGERLAVISGGGTGIGAATAEALAVDGFDVLVVGRREETLRATTARLSWDLARPGAVRSVVADLTDPQQVPRVVKAVEGRAVDAIVNNAGGYLGGEAETLVGIAEQWRANLEANVLTAVLLTEALRPALRRPGGRVILVSSIAAQRGGGGPYSAAKAALHGWAYDLAVRLGPEQITVNVVSPGYVADTEFFGGRMTPEGHARRVAATLVGRAGTPDDIAAAVRYLAGPAAGYVTGQVLGVNGGSVLGR